MMQPSPSDGSIVIIAPDASICLSARSSAIGVRPGHLLPRHGMQEPTGTDCHMNICRPCGALGQPCCDNVTCSKGRCAAGLCGAIPGLVFLMGGRTFTDLTGDISIDLSFNTYGTITGAAGGDWNGDGIDTLGLYLNGTNQSQFNLATTNGPGRSFRLSISALPPPITSRSRANGGPASSPRPASMTPPRTPFWLDPALSTAYAQITFTVFGAPTNAQPIAGDWTHQGYDTVGLYDPDSATFYQWTPIPTAGRRHSLFRQSPFHLRSPVLGSICHRRRLDGDGLDTVGLVSRA